MLCGFSLLAALSLNAQFRSSEFELRKFICKVSMTCKKLSNVNGQILYITHLHPSLSSTLEKMFYFFLPLVDKSHLCHSARRAMQASCRLLHICIARCGRGCSSFGCCLLLIQYLIFISLIFKSMGRTTATTGRASADVVRYAFIILMKRGALRLFKYSQPWRIKSIVSWCRNKYSFV